MGRSSGLLALSAPHPLFRAVSSADPTSPHHRLVKWARAGYWYPSFLVRHSGSLAQQPGCHSCSFGVHLIPPKKAGSLSTCPRVNGRRMCLGFLLLMNFFPQPSV